MLPGTGLEAAWKAEGGECGADDVRLGDGPARRRYQCAVFAATTSQFTIHDLHNRELSDPILKMDHRFFDQITRCCGFDSLTKRQVRPQQPILKIEQRTTISSSSHS